VNYVTRRDTAIVIGCGPVGLATTCHLKAQGAESIVASDFAPGRRHLLGEPIGWEAAGNRSSTGGTPPMS
jgi:threonine dehydrogenase-like Zn-dependent dehydrogenase